MLSDNIVHELISVHPQRILWLLSKTKTRSSHISLSDLISSSPQTTAGNDPLACSHDGVKFSFLKPQRRNRDTIRKKLEESCYRRAFIMDLELKQDLGCSVPSHNNLEKWAVQIMYKVEQNIGYLVKEEGERSYSNANGWKKISSNLSFRY
ncbi:uracil-DNA glycosylase [Trifolium repens]|nr:uracil-DNA glycosylase [Trifolium repens]